jgi:hypothetical protein
MPGIALLEAAQFEYQILLLYLGIDSENIGLVNKCLEDALVFRPCNGYGRIYHR